jgi:hypothetical protein
VGALDAGADTVFAGLLTGLALAGIDLVWRARGGRAADAGQVIATLALYAATATLVTAGLHGALAVERVLCRRLSAKSARLGLIVRLVLVAVLAAACAHGTATWTFGGARVRTSALARWGPWLMMLGLGVWAALVAWLTSAARRSMERGRLVGPAAMAVVLVAVAIGLVLVDLRVYVSLYARLHTLLEVVAALHLLCAAFVLLALAPRRAVRGVSAAALAWLALWAVAKRPQDWLEQELRRTWVEPVYAGRMLSRVQAVRSFLADPEGWRGTSASGLDRLKSDFDVQNTTLDPAWTAAVKEPPRATLAKLRSGVAKPNVVVFYVDTLRHDVAADPRVMPNLAELFRTSVYFRRAYAAGSDTLRSLPAMTGGALGPAPGGPEDFLTVAQRGGWRRGLVIAQSAHEFLDKESPGFQFDDRVVVDDYAPVRMDVWGYGADQPAAAALVDRSLEWMKVNKDRPFLLWTFHFDQHNWRELGDRHIAQTARTYDMPEGEGMKRYAVVARGIDVELGRFLRGLDQLGLRDRTILVFVSDHGEGVGREGFWVHSIFLWEVLMRVPLAIRIPGVPPAVVDAPVSLMDLAPTLARWFDPERSLAGYQGENLLARLDPKHRLRNRPLLIRSGTRDQERMIGLIDPAGTSKLVVQLESGVPELYDLSAEDPDASDLAGEQPTRALPLLNQLVRSPVFPRDAGEKPR